MFSRSKPAPPPGDELILQAASRISGLGLDAIRTSWDRRARRTGARGSGGYEFVVLPSRQLPLWFVPIGGGSASAAALSIYHPYALRGRILKTTLRAGLSCGWYGKTGDRIAIERTGPLELEKLVEEVSGERRPVFSISLGTIGGFRKLTVHVMDAGGSTLGYLKLPLTPGATARVRNEARALTVLEQHSRLRGRIPRVLFAGDWRDGYILYQTAGAGSSGSVYFDHTHRWFLSRLAEVGTVSRSGAEVATEVAARWGAHSGLLSAQHLALGAHALDYARSCLGDVAVACGAAHGDFAPWNTLRTAGGLYVYDWENFREDAPFAWDYFHFCIQTAILLGRRQGPVFQEVCRHVEDESHFTGLLLLYLLSSAAGQIAEEGNRTQAAVDARLQWIRRLLP